MNNQQIKTKILEDVSFSKGAGYTLIYGDWGDQNMRCACPLGCVNLAFGTRPEDEEMGGVMSVLGVDDKWVGSFIDGYDNNGEAKGALVPDAWKMGAEIRKEFHPIEMGDFINQMDQL